MATVCQLLAIKAHSIYTYSPCVAGLPANLFLPQGWQPRFISYSAFQRHQMRSNRNLKQGLEAEQTALLRDAIAVLKDQISAVEEAINQSHVQLELIWLQIAELHRARNG